MVRNWGDEVDGAGERRRPNGRPLEERTRPGDEPPARPRASSHASLPPDDGTKPRSGDGCSWWMKIGAACGGASVAVTSHPPVASFTVETGLQRTRSPPSRTPPRGIGAREVPPHACIRSRKAADQRSHQGYRGSTVPSPHRAGACWPPSPRAPRCRVPTTISGREQDAPRGSCGGILRDPDTRVGPCTRPDRRSAYGARLTMERAVSGRGDYRGAGAYGLRAASCCEELRETGTVGVVAALGGAGDRPHACGEPNPHHARGSPRRRTSAVVAANSFDRHPSSRPTTGATLWHDDATVHDVRGRGERR